MRAILPGRPQARRQAVTTGSWDDKQIIAYISGNAIVILDGPTSLLQTTYQESPDELVAVVFDEISGKIAAASAKQVHIYRPYGQDEGALRWSLQCHLSLEDEKDTIETLSWGLDEELLVGSSCLTLFSTYHGSNRVWSKPLANPAQFASFSYDTSLIVTCGRYDKVVKVWRPMSLADKRFEFAYLPHPAVVTGIHWRKPFHREQSFENVLYTLCADNKLRIWVPGDPLNNDVLRLWDEIDLVQSIQPRSIAPEDRSSKRYAFIIDSKDITVATERAVQQASNDEREQHALDHLIEIANRTPEVCVVLDDRGNMSAWGLDSISCKARKSGDIFNVAHSEGLNISFNRQTIESEDNIQFSAFCDTSRQGNLAILVNHFDGRLEWYESRLDKLFDSSPHKRRLTLRAHWTGHAGPIKKVVRTALGRAVISRTEDNRSVIWTQASKSEDAVLRRKSRILHSKHIHRVWLLREGDYAVFLHHDCIVLWDCRTAIATEVAKVSYTLVGTPLCLVCLPEPDTGEGLFHLVTISSEMKGISWEVALPSAESSNQESIAQFDTFNLGSAKDLAYVLPVDPAGTAPVISGFLDTFARDVAISWTLSGVIKTWTAKADLDQRKILWLNTATVETSIERPAMGSATSIRKAAIVDTERMKLSIWNTRSGQLEHEEKFDNTIHDLDWSSTPDNQSLLAVGFGHRVLVYAQLRFDYLDDRPSWAVIKQVSIREYTSHPIGDSVWLGNGNLIIGAGNQLYVDDSVVTPSEDMDSDLRAQLPSTANQDIFTVVSRLNGPLPIYHPQFISQTVLAGKIVLAQRILVKLLKVMRFYSDGESFDTQLGFTDEDFSATSDAHTNGATKGAATSYAELSEDESQTVDDSVAAALVDVLAARRIPYLSSREQLRLANIVDCAATAEKHRRSVDDNAARFLLFFRQHILHPSRQSTNMISWREITWAFHSQSQDILADLVSEHFNNKMLWENAKESGIFMWMSDLTALRAQFEKIARNEYTKSEDKNPIDCSLYYLALRKKAVLVGLWRMATFNKEQAATQRLLSNNFQEPRWKTAALKNAYALMGKRRFEYAAAFFLLADKLGDAVNVLANQHGDLQLAIAIARVYGGDDCQELKGLIEERILPQAALEGNRWLATWAYWILGRRDKAVQSLVSPLTSIMSPPETPNLQSRLFSTDDPALIVLYKQLREKSLQTLKGALAISPRAEWEFIMHITLLYGRMGCDLLALDLVRTWEFLMPIQSLRRPSSTVASSISLQSPLDSSFPIFQDPAVDPRKLLRRRSSLVVDDLTSATEPRRPSLTHLKSHQTHSYNADAPHPSAIEEDEEVQSRPAATNGHTIPKPGSAAPTKKPPPTQFTEPDASSLLDAFGF